MEPAPSITIEALNKDILGLYAASGMDRGALGRSAVEWTFARNEAPFAVARFDGEIVGLSAYIQSRLKIGTKTGVAYQAVDSFVSPQMRGKGLFTTLARAYAAHAAASGGDLVWGFPNDNAATAWFKKLGWSNSGQIPLMVKPLRAGYFLRKARLPLDFPLSLDRDQNLSASAEPGAWVDFLWEHFSREIPCAVIRDREALVHRLFSGPHAGAYRVVAVPGEDGALVATREASKHGGRIAYLMEAIGGVPLEGILRSELARLRDGGAELMLAWCFPWSPNCRMLRRCGFLPLPERLRPFRIWFGGRAASPAGRPGEDHRNWYLSYLDSDTA